jgi:excisionase family DNA binding protein
MDTGSSSDTHMSFQVRPKTVLLSIAIMSLDETMNLPTVASYLGARTETVAQLARKGELPGAQIGKGWIFLREDVLRFLRNRIARETESRRAARVKEQSNSQQGDNAEAVAVATPRARTRRRELPALPELVGHTITKVGTPNRFLEDSHTA